MSKNPTDADWAQFLDAIEKEKHTEARLASQAMARKILLQIPITERNKDDKND